MKTFKVLSIDGGGIKGLYSAEILRHLEEEFNCSIADHFDLLCGTSTGGLIALALACKVPARTIVEFYAQKGSTIFPPRNPLLRKVRQALVRSKYGSHALRAALVEMFGENRIGDAHSLLCIPSYAITDARPYIFKYDHEEGRLRRDNRTLMVDVALATAAAPTFFPIVSLPHHEGKQFIDGGVYANNPTIIGTVEALHYFVGEGKPYSNLEVLSVSSLEVPQGMRLDSRLDKSIARWGARLVTPFMMGQARMVEETMKRLASLSELRLKYVRIPSATISPYQAKDIDLDKASPKSLSLIKGMGSDQGFLSRKHEETRAFFDQPKYHNIQSLYGQLS